MHHSFTSFRTIYLVLPYDNGKLPRMVFTCLFLKLGKIYSCNLYDQSPQRLRTYLDTLFLHLYHEYNK